MRKTVRKALKKTAKKKTPTKQVKIRLYKTYDYKFDPVIDEVLDLLKLSDMKFSQASKESGVSASTIHNWNKGKTRRPQSATIEAVGRACGYGRKWVRINDK